MPWFSICMIVLAFTGAFGSWLTLIIFAISTGYSVKNRTFRRWDLPFLAVATVLAGLGAGGWIYLHLKHEWLPGWWLLGVSLGWALFMVVTYAPIRWYYDERPGHWQL